MGVTIFDVCFYQLSSLSSVHVLLWAFFSPSFFFSFLRLASHICSHPGGIILQVIPESRFGLSGHQGLQVHFPTPMLHYEKYFYELEKRFV